MRAQRLWAMLAFGLSMAVWGAPGSSPRVAELDGEAQKLSSQTGFREAAELLKATEIAPKPRLRDKLAEALERARETSEAPEYHRQYTASPKTDPVLLKRANNSIAGLLKHEAKVKKSQHEVEVKKAQEVGRPRSDEGPPAAEVQIGEGTQLGAPPIEVQPEVPGLWAARIEAARRRLEAQRALDSWRLWRKGAFASGGLALLVVGSGGLLGWHALGARSAFNEAETWQEKDSLKAASQQRARLADTCVGVGLALAVVAGIILPKSPEPTVPAKEAWEVSAPKVSLSVGPGAAALEVRF